MNSKKEVKIDELDSKIREKYEELKSIEDNNTKKSSIMNEIWELSKEKFILTTKSINDIKNYMGMIFTVGFSPEPIILNILANNPNAIFFVYTKESEEFLERIIKETKLTPSQYKREIMLKDSFASSMDLIAIGLAYLNGEKGIELPKIGLDITGGTKIMSVACALAAFCLGPNGPDIFYITHEKYDKKLRRPVPGTELLKIIKNPLRTGCDTLRNQGIDVEMSGGYHI